MDGVFFRSGLGCRQPPSGRKRREGRKAPKRRSGAVAGSLVDWAQRSGPGAFSDASMPDVRFGACCARPPEMLGPSLASGIVSPRAFCAVPVAVGAVMARGPTFHSLKIMGPLEIHHGSPGWGVPVGLYRSRDGGTRYKPGSLRAWRRGILRGRGHGTRCRPRTMPWLYLITAWGVPAVRLVWKI